MSQVSQILYKKESSNMVYICNIGDCIMGSRFRDIAHILLFFYLVFFLSLYCMLILKICVRVFFGIVETRILKLFIHMDNELLYCGIENWTPCSYSSLYLSIFLSFKAKFVSQFSQELCKLESSNMVYMCRIRYCFMGLRLRVVALIFLFFASVFLSFPISHVNI